MTYLSSAQCLLRGPPVGPVLLVEEAALGVEAYGCYFLLSSVSKRIFSL